MAEAQQNHVRPTEAQLRWAGFHFKKRASSVKIAVENFYLHPPNVKDVEGAFSEDGNTTEDSSSSSTPSSCTGGCTAATPRSEQDDKRQRKTAHGRRRRRPKVKVSKGRRALLRVSQRKYEQRRKEITKHGFGTDRCGSDETDDDDAALEELFAGETFQRRRRKRRRNPRSAKDADRVRRFESAFHSMMKNLHASQQPRHVIETPTRIWTRPEGAEPLETLDYSAMKLLGSHQKIHNPNNGRLSFYNLPVDRGASWLVHNIPGKNQHAYHPSHGPDGPSLSADSQQQKQSPGRKLYKDLVTEFQHRVRSPLVETDDMALNTPPSKLSKYFVPAQLGGEEEDEGQASSDPHSTSRGDGSMVRARSASLLNRQSTEEQLDTVIHSIDPQLLKEMEELDPGVTDRLRALYLGDDSPRVHVKEIAKQIESSPRDEEGGFVQRFVAFVEHAMQMRQEELVAADGKLQKAAFARLVNQYLLETGNKNKYRIRSSSTTPPTNNVSRIHKKKSNNNSSSNSHKVPAVAHAIMMKMSGTCCERKEGSATFLDSQGGFDRQAFGNLVTRYLSDATGMEEETVLEMEDLETLTSLSLQQRPTLDEEPNDHIVSISRELALDFGQAIERLLLLHSQQSTTLPSNQISSEVEEITKQFLMDNCGVRPEEYGKNLSKEELAFSQTVSDLRDTTLSAIHRRAQTGTWNPSSFQERISSHLVQFFKASMVNEVGSRGGEHERERRRSLVTDLISRIQETAAVEQLATPEGYLKVPVITKLMQRYFAAASSQQNQDGDFLRQAQSPLALAQVRRMAGSRRHRSGDDDYSQIEEHPIAKEDASRFVARCIQDLEIKSRDQVIVTVDGTIDEVKLGEILRQCFDPNYFIGTQEENSINDRLGGSSDADHHHEERTVISELTYESIQTSNNNEGPRTINDDEPHTSKPVGRIVNSVSRSLGGLVRRLYRTEEEDGVVEERLKNNNVDDEEEMKAYSAFRRTSRGAQSDEFSSDASFFKEGLKSMVKRLGSPTEKQENEENGVVVERVDSRNNKFGRLKFSVRKGELLTNLLEASGKDPLIIDTDGQSDLGASTRHHHERMKNLLLSPATITKRHRQAIRCIENRQWKEVQYLMSANPWLAEMSDANTKQYLLHKLALYGAGEVVRTENGSFARQAAAPLIVSTDMIRLFPSSVHKFDQEGNLPLHMAAASANVSVAQLLGDRFPSGATVRNEDGLLPLHLALLACGSPITAGYGDAKTLRELVQTMFGYFPGAVAVTDNEGNLPIHSAAGVLRGEVGVEAIFMLFDEAERQLQDPCGVRFRNKLKLEELENMSIDTEVTETPTDSSNNLDDALQCTMVRNDHGETPLLCAIRAGAKWEVIEALVQGPCGRESALSVDEDGNNALHLLLDEGYQDPTSALSVLKVAPEAACVRNNDGMLPIELACMHSLPIEVIMAIVIVDLPIDIDNKEEPERRTGFGESWWFIACDCDDHYAEIVDEIVAISSVAQVRELAYMENTAGESAISRAAPESKEILRCSLRFLGRFEIKTEMALPESLAPEGVAIFEAIDFGYPDDALEDGIDVFLKFFPDQNLYDSETTAVRELEFDFSLVEEVFAFDIGELGDEVFDESKQFCLCIERPKLTLAGVVSGMMRNGDCQNNPKTRKRYALKALAVLRAAAKGLAHLHSLGFVHGNLSVDNIGKYDNAWKLAGISRVQRIGGAFDSSRLSSAVPPEAISPVQKLGPASHEASFRSDLIVSWPIDSWGFGKLAYEVFVGQQLVVFDDSKDFELNHNALMDIMHWNDFNLQKVGEDLLRVGVSESAVGLIQSCLAPDPSSRPSAAAIADHDAWRELRRFRPGSPTSSV